MAHDAVLHMHRAMVYPGVETARKSVDASWIQNMRVLTALPMDALAAKTDVGTPSVYRGSESAAPHSDWALPRGTDVSMATDTTAATEATGTGGTGATTATFVCPTYGVRVLLCDFATARRVALVPHNSDLVGLVALRYGIGSDEQRAAEAVASMWRDTRHETQCMLDTLRAWYAELCELRAMFVSLPCTGGEAVFNAAVWTPPVCS